MFNLFGRKKNTPETLSERIEKDKQQLLEDLRTKGMAYLVKQMISDEDYSPLLKQTRDSSIRFDSGDSVSWYAYRQSDILNAAKDKEELLLLLESQQFSTYKKYIYRCLSCICGNTNDKALFNFLIDKINVEDDENITTAILTKLGNVKKDEGYNIEPIKILAKEGSSDESLAAIKALSHTNDPEIEDLLLYEFKIGSSFMKGMICGPLATVATAKSVPVLKEEFKQSRDTSLRWSIDNILHNIEKHRKT